MIISSNLSLNDIDFFRIPWLEVNLYFFIFVFLLFIFILLLKFIYRWNSVEVTNLDYKYLYIEYCKDKTTNIKRDYKKSIKLKYLQVETKDVNEIKDHPKNLILIITPFFISEKKFSYFGSAIAQINKKFVVVILSLRNLLKFIKKFGLNDIYNFLMINFKPNYLIIFDFFPIIFSECFKNQENSNNELNLIVIRPFLSRNSFSLIKATPFSHKWWYILFSKIWLIKNGFLNILKKRNTDEILILIEHSKILLIIHNLKNISNLEFYVL